MTRRHIVRAKCVRANICADTFCANTFGVDTFCTDNIFASYRSLLSIFKRRHDPVAERAFQMLGD